MYIQLFQDTRISLKHGASHYQFWVDLSYHCCDSRRYRVSSLGRASYTQRGLPDMEKQQLGLNRPVMYVWQDTPLLQNKNRVGGRVIDKIGVWGARTIAVCSPLLLLRSSAKSPRGGYLVYSSMRRTQHLLDHAQHLFYGIPHAQRVAVDFLFRWHS